MSYRKQLFVLIVEQYTVKIGMTNQKNYTNDSVQIAKVIVESRVFCSRFKHYHRLENEGGWHLEILSFANLRLSLVDSGRIFLSYCSYRDFLKDHSSKLTWRIAFSLVRTG